jgi:hypothetical protein
LGVDEEGENLMRHIYVLLAGNRELAYSSGELEEAVFPLGGIPATELEKFRRARDVLVGISAVEKRWVGDTDYYAFFQEFDNNTWERVPQRQTAKVKYH